MRELRKYEILLPMNSLSGIVRRDNPAIEMTC
jgi:hypothetical protein